MTFHRLLLSIAAALAPSLAMADSFWDHNGSVMRLQASGDQRFFFYETPRSGMRSTGVTQGTLLFDGVRQGNRYSGTARVFSRRCARPMAYPMSGTVVNEGLVVLEGIRPEFTNCVPNGQTRYERLVFSLIGAAPTPVAPAPAPAPLTAPVPKPAPAPAPAPAALAVPDQAAAIARAVEILLGPPYGVTQQETRGYITTIGWEAGECGGPNTWVIGVLVPGAATASGEPIEGLLGIAATSGEMVCTTLPLLD